MTARTEPTMRAQAESPGPPAMPALRRLQQEKRDFTAILGCAAESKATLESQTYKTVSRPYNAISCCPFKWKWGYYLRETRKVLHLDWWFTLFFIQALHFLYLCFYDMKQHVCIYFYFSWVLFGGFFGGCVLGPNLTV